MAGMGMHAWQYNVKKFECIQKVAMWAGFLGMGQALCWMALTVTGIISYNCKIYAEPSYTFGSMISYAFFDLYFRGNCYPKYYVKYDDSVLTSVETILDSEGILIWECVYLAVAFLWFCSSVLIITNLRKDHKQGTSGLLLTWASITLCICLMDFALGVIFGVDFGNFHEKALSANLDTAQSGPVTATNAQLIAGEVVAMSMMIISFKGFVLWIVNLGFLIYLAVEAFKIMFDNDGNDTLFIPRKISEDVLANQPPINAYEDEKISTAFINESYVPDNRSMVTVELNQEALTRAARMSTDVSLQERRFRNLDGFQQYPPPRTNSAKQTIPENSGSTTGVSAFPVPDYSPPMSRAYQGQSQNGVLRNQRY